LIYLRHLPSQLTEAVSRATTGETVLWMQQPDPKDAFASRRFAWWIGITALMFSLFGEAHVLGIIPNERARQQSIADISVMACYVAFFVLVALAFCWLPFAAARRAQTTAYVLTTVRIHVIGGRRSPRALTDVAIDKIISMDLSQRWSDLRLVAQVDVTREGERIETAMLLERLADGPAVTALIGGLR
jgi:hypothetical protein